MIIFESILLGLNQLRVHKLRSILSILGILISVGSVTGIVSLGDGLRETVTQHFEQQGGPSCIWVRSPNQWYRNDKGRWVRRNWEDYLENHDIGYLLEASDNIAYIAPVIRTNSDIQYKKASTQCRLWGSNPYLLKTENWKVGAGRFINEYDVSNASKVAVIGSDLAKNLFGEQNPVGLEIEGDGERYLVIGVLEPLQFFGGTNERNAIVPYTTLQSRHIGNKRLDRMTVMAQSPEHVPEVALQIQRVLKRHHTHGDEFMIETGESRITQFNRVVTILKIVAGGIAGISLLVGGIGIMNIMLVSVTERTREIGLRKSLGARRRTIMLQFIIEAMVMCLFGGFLGILFGLGMGSGLEAWIQSTSFEVPFNSVVSPGLMVFAVLYSAAIGMFFGVYPAWRASRLDPVEALRK